jgi:dTDP-4-amino-4,6-dideoxygalactose transaminase
MRSVTLAEWKATRKQKKLIKEVIKSGRLTYGPKTRELEQKFAEIHGAKHAIFTSSGTAALKISLHALKDKHGWKDGSEVIIPATTFVATMNAVIMNNLKPVLVDVKQETANINPELIEKAITKKTVAIIPVHLLGQPAEMDAIMKIAKKHKLEVVEDSCETMFVNKLRGTTACFSTYIAHLMVTGVGGFILTNDAKLATTMRSMLFHGRDESYLNIDDKPTDIWKRFYFPRRGYSDRMTELEAAIGLGELDDWQKMIQKRRNNAAYLIERLAFIFPITGIQTHSFMFFPIYVPDRDELMIHLEKQGIQTRTMMPLISQPITKPYLKKNYPVAQYIIEHGMLLPVHQYLKKKDLDHMVNSIKEFYNG